MSAIHNLWLHPWGGRSPENRGRGHIKGPLHQRTRNIKESSKAREAGQRRRRRGPCRVRQLRSTYLKTSMENSREPFDLLCDLGTELLKVDVFLEKLQHLLYHGDKVGRRTAAKPPPQEQQSPLARHLKEQARNLQNRDQVKVEAMEVDASLQDPSDQDHSVCQFSSEPDIEVQSPSEPADSLGEDLLTEQSFGQEHEEQGQLEEMVMRADVNQLTLRDLFCQVQELHENLETDSLRTSPLLTEDHVSVEEVSLPDQSVPEQETVSEELQEEQTWTHGDQLSQELEAVGLSADLNQQELRDLFCQVRELQEKLGMAPLPGQTQDLISELLSDSEENQILPDQIQGPVEERQEEQTRSSAQDEGLQRRAEEPGMDIGEFLQRESAKLLPLFQEFETIAGETEKIQTKRRQLNQSFLKERRTFHRQLAELHKDQQKQKQLISHMASSMKHVSPPT